jgi:hypothetical protein
MGAGPVVPKCRGIVRRLLREARGDMQRGFKSYIIVLVVIALVGLAYVAIFGFHTTFFLQHPTLP